MNRISLNEKQIANFDYISNYDETNTSEEYQWFLHVT